MQTEIIVFTGILCGSIGFFACALMASHTIRHYDRQMDEVARELEKALEIIKWHKESLISKQHNLKMEKIKMVQVAAMRMIELKPENRESYERMLKEAIDEIDAQEGKQAS